MKKNRLTLNCHEMKILNATEPGWVLLPLPAPVKKNAKARVKEGRRFKTGELIVPGVYSTVTGTVEKVEPLFTRAGEFEALRIKVAEQDEFDSEIQAEPDFTVKKPIEILSKLNTANLGFREELEAVKTVVVSAVDTDPLHTTLQQILRQEKDRVSEGFRLILHLTSSERLIFAVPAPLAEMAADAVAGIAAVEIFPVKPVHPNGLPSVLLKKIAVKHDIANHLFIDIEKVMASIDALKNGRPQVYKNITIVDEKGSRNARVRIGTLVKDLLADSGLKDNDKVILGGAMIGYACFSTDIPITGTIDSVYVQYNSQGQVDLDRNNQCMSCGRCVRECPAGLDVNLICRYSEFSIFEKCLELDVMACIECGLCAYHCPSGRSLVQLIRLAKQETEKIEEGEEVA